LASFRSRGESDFADKVLSTLRCEFRGLDEEADDDDRGAG
jgi:6-phosphogluconate dehydrogenase (decarboxylating)